RPSERFPTLEMRITDMCTNLADAVGVAALTQCVLHWLYRRHRCDPGRGNFPRFLIDQNRWRAIRYGLDEGLLDFDTDKLVPVVDQLDGLLNAVREDAEELGCLSELEHLREIPKRGTSAHRQLRVHSQALADGASPEEALRAVVDMLLEQTLEGI
ncbi:MAG: carboxylate-amine ligase, partial [Gammaproteobacteria bacterium]|nr:carboxylate-amine ligase [Gammaproteobacteria bacterium]